MTLEQGTSIFKDRRFVADLELDFHRILRIPDVGDLPFAVEGKGFESSCRRE
jgi:hypothetical protein